MLPAEAEVTLRFFYCNVVYRSVFARLQEQQHFGQSCEIRFLQIGHEFSMPLLNGFETNGKN